MRSTMQDTPLSIGRLVRHGTRVYGDSTVRTWTGDGFREATYAQLGRRAAQLAHGLRGLGIDGDQRVGTLMWNNQEHMEAYLAVPAMGAVLHTLNLRLFPEQLAYIADHAEDQVIIVDGTVVPLLAAVLDRLPTVDHVIVSGEADLAALEGKGAELHRYEDVLAGQEETFDWPEVDERDAAAMCYTSGTTGNPKGVAYSHRSIVLHSMAGCMGTTFNLGSGDCVLAIVPQFHAMAWGLPYAAMTVGASLVMTDRFLAPDQIIAMVRAGRPNKAGAVPTIWQGVLAQLKADGGDLAGLESAIVGGSACPPSLMEAFRDDYGMEIVHAWGMTETSPIGSVARPATGADEETAWRQRVTQGRFICGVDARLIADDGTEQPWDDEAVGELQCRGPWITASYYRDDDPDKFDGGWLRTGDVGRISPDGFLTLTDRAKDVIKSGGEWISSVDLENAIMGHPAIAEAAVIGIPDERWDERPLASVVLADGQDATPEDLREFLASKVAKWQLPETWAFIDEVPKTSVGKFDKKVLRQRYADGELEVSRVS